LPPGFIIRGLFYYQPTFHPPIQVGFLRAKFSLYCLTENKAWQLAMCWQQAGVGLVWLISLRHPWNASSAIRINTWNAAEEEISLCLAYLWEKTLFYIRVNDIFDACRSFNKPPILLQPFFLSAFFAFFYSHQQNVKRKL